MMSSSFIIYSVSVPTTVDVKMDDDGAFCSVTFLPEDVRFSLFGVRNVRAFRQAVLEGIPEDIAEAPELPFAPEDVEPAEPEEAPQICEECLAHWAYDPQPGKELVEGQWLCERHAEEYAQSTPEREADEWYDQRKDGEG